MTTTHGAVRDSRTGGGREASTVEAAHARLIAARLPLFSVLWLGLAVVWSVLLVVQGRLDVLAATAYCTVLGAAFAAAVGIARRDPEGWYVRWVAVAACMLAVVSAATVVAHMHGYGEVAGVSHLLLGFVSSFMFAWGWRIASMLALSSFLAWWGAQPWRRLLISPEEFWVGYLFGVLVWVAIAEASFRSFRALWWRRQAERAALTELEASRDAYRDLAENARDQIWVADLEGRVLYVNQAVARFHQVPASDLVGRSVFAMITDHPRNPEVDDVLARIVRGETLPPLLIQVVASAAPGDPRWHEVLLSPIHGPDGSVSGVRGISRDVSERVHAEEQLRQSEERFRGAFASTSVGLTITDVAGHGLQLNDAVCTMLGYSREELSTMTIDDATHPDDRQATNAARRDLMAGVRPSFVLEKRFIRRDGQVVWGLVNVSLLRDGRGDPVAFIGLVQDVTERRLADDAVRRSHQDLRESREKLRRLARQQVTIREEERKRLGLDLHDDVCQELVGMAIMIESVRRRVDALSESDARDLSRMARTANELGEHLRLVAHELRPVQLGDIGLEGSLRSLAAGLSTADCSVETAFPTSVPRLDEETELGVYRIAQEALSNAVRHAKASLIAVTFAVDDESLRLEVRDDGCGFAVGARGDGMGLLSMEERGLALGGRVTVTSAPHTGTVVRLTCPAHARPADLGSAPQAASMTGR